MRAREFITEANKACGDCFVVAGRAMIYDKIPELKLVHAYVSGQGNLEGKRFAHAWNEIGDVVFDYSNGRKVVMRREQYYRLGNVSTEPGEYAVYDDIEATKKIARNRHWGPWDLDPAKENLKEVNAPGELSVPEELVQRFTDRGWSIAGEGRDQIVLSKPGNLYVLKIVGQGSGQRIDIIRRYIDFYRQHQRNPHFPKVGGDRTFRWQDKTYYAYTQEQLKHLPGDEAVLDYLEYAMGELSHDLEPRFDRIPPGLKVEQIEGLIYAVDELFGAGIGDAQAFDLGNVYNIMQRDNGQLVIVDPFADWNDEEVNENFADGRVKGRSRPGRVKRAGASCAGSVTDLRAKARKYSGERGRMYHWCANMKGGRK